MQIEYAISSSSSESDSQNCRDRSGPAQSRGVGVETHEFVRELLALEVVGAHFRDVGEVGLEEPRCAGEGRNWSKARDGRLSVSGLGAVQRRQTYGALRVESSASRALLTRCVHPETRVGERRREGRRRAPRAGWRDGRCSNA